MLEFGRGVLSHGHGHASNGIVLQGLVSRCRYVLSMFVFVSRCYTATPKKSQTFERRLWLMWLCFAEVMEAGDKLREALEGRNAANIDHLRRNAVILAPYVFCCTFVQCNKMM